jgi:hypothetical protein
MVVIPVESGDEDVSGRIPLWAIKVARAMHGTLGLRCGGKLVIESARRGTAHGKRPVLDFPSIDRVMSQIDNGKDQAVISLDARKLLQLVEALLDSGEWRSGVALHVRGPRAPILVRPHIGPHSSEQDGRFAVLMPLEPKEEEG